MAEHRTLTGNQLHEPKGADTAANGTVYISDGAGSGTWSTITPSQSPDVMVLAQGTKTGTGNPYDVDINLPQKYDSNGLYDPGTGLLTAAQSGTYLVDVSFTIVPTGNGDVNFVLQKNGTDVETLSQDTNERNRFLTVVTLAASDTINLNCNGGNNSGFTLDAAMLIKKVV